MGGGNKDRSGELCAQLQAQMAQQEADAHRRLLGMEAQHSQKMKELQMQQTLMLLEQEEANKRYQREQDAKFEEYAAENAKLVQELKNAEKTMEQELKKVKDKYMQGATDPDQYDEVQNEIFQKFCHEVAKAKDVPKTKKPSVAVLGQNGVGKSSLINALAEKFVTPVGDVDTTTVVSKVHESSTTEYWDVPGCSEERSYTNLKQIMAIKEMHLIIIVYVDRVEHIVKLEKFIRACKVPYLCVRNKVDQIVDKDGNASQDLKKEAAQLEAKKLSAPLIFVSTKTGEGISNLKHATHAILVETTPSRNASKNAHTVQQSLASSSKEPFSPPSRDARAKVATAMFKEEDIAKVMACGFDTEAARTALEAMAGDVHAAVNLLLDS